MMNGDCDDTATYNITPEYDLDINTMIKKNYLLKDYLAVVFVAFPIEGRPFVFSILLR